MFLGKPKIKQKTVLVQRPPTVTVNSSPAPRTPAHVRPGGGAAAARSYSASRAPPSNRYQVSRGANVGSQRETGRRAAGVESRKRKGTDTPQWASSDESSEGEEG